MKIDQLKLRLLAFAGLAVASFTALPQAVQATDLINGGNVGYSWSILNAPASGLSDITFPMTFGATTVHASGTYVAQQFNFTGQQDVGYMGLQPRPDRNGKARLAAAFSSFIAGTMTTDNAYCSNGADGGPGVSCGTEFDAVYGHTYALTVAKTGQDTWTGTVTDTVTGARVHIGTYALPAGSGLLRSSQMGFVEAYLGVPSCPLNQQVDVEVGKPTTSINRLATVGPAWEYGSCVGQASFSTSSDPNGIHIARGTANPVMSAAKGVNVTGTTVNVRLDSNAVAGANRLIVYVDGAYATETYAGAAYYGSKVTAGTTTTLTATVPAITSHSTVEVYLAPNAPGEAATGKARLGAFTHTNTVVTGIGVDGSTVNVALDNSAVAGANRFIVYVDGSYAMETYAGTVYYGSKSINGSIANLSTSVPAITSQSTIQVYLAPGTPGQSAVGKTLLGSFKLR